MYLAPAMSIKRALLKLAYPLYRILARQFTERGKIVVNTESKRPGVSFYSLSIPLNDGTLMPLSELRGRKVLIVNTASNCVYTSQYAGLEQLHRQTGDQLAVIGFPANDFANQERASDAEIAHFCKRNYGVSFPIAAKSQVTGSEKNAVYRWLTDEKQNGWNSREPVWNFSKYLVNETGVLTHYFGPAVKPTQVLRIAFEE
jgi:glutathione peroxidase